MTQMRLCLPKWNPKGILLRNVQSFRQTPCQLAAELKGVGRGSRSFGREHVEGLGSQKCNRITSGTSAAELLAALRWLLQAASGWWCLDYICEHAPQHYVSSGLAAFGFISFAPGLIHLSRTMPAAVDELSLCSQQPNSEKRSFHRLSLGHPSLEPLHFPSSNLLHLALSEVHPWRILLWCCAGVHPEAPGS